jgi:hypothetical protein
MHAFYVFLLISKPHQYAADATRNSKNKGKNIETSTRSLYPHTIDKHEIKEMHAG